MVVHVRPGPLHRPSVSISIYTPDVKLLHSYYKKVRSKFTREGSRTIIANLFHDWVTEMTLIDLILVDNCKQQVAILHLTI